MNPKKRDEKKTATSVLYQSIFFVAFENKTSAFMKLPWEFDR